jgi:hypothetical protein
MNDFAVIVLPTWAYWLLVLVAVLGSIELILKIVNHFLARRLKAGQARALPDPLTSADGESPEYTSGWNDCRQAMIHKENT